MQLYFIIIINQNYIKKRHYKLTGENIMFWINPMTGNTRLTKEQENITYCIYCHPVNSKFTTCAENGSWVEFINTKRSLRYVWRRIIKVNKLLNKYQDWSPKEWLCFIILVLTRTGRHLTRVGLVRRSCTVLPAMWGSWVCARVCSCFYTVSARAWARCPSHPICPMPIHLNNIYKNRLPNIHSSTCLFFKCFLGYKSFLKYSLYSATVV